MDLPEPLPLSAIARHINAQIIGDASLMVTGINEIHKVREGDLTFADVEKYFAKAINSAATVIILNKEAECPPGKALLICDNPFAAYDGLVREYNPPQPLEALVDPAARIHPSAIIEPQVVIGPDVEIGEETLVEAGAVIRGHCIIGKRVIIQSGARIGTDAFYFKKTNEGHIKWTSGGRVVIEDDVYVGANTTINRGVSGDTVIGAGTKIDCLVHVGHGVVIGKHCVIAGQVGVSGKAVLGDHVTIYGQVGIAPATHIGDNVTIHPQAGVGGDLEAGKRYFGTPAVELRTKWREIAAVKQLPAILRNLEKE
jgi:UDP-3-O-[3-hydroxymyristoyl] glucosamine N-acyltransferase